MVNYKCDKKGNISLHAEGSDREFCADVMVLIRRLYDLILLNDTAEAANIFVNNLAMGIMDPDHPLFEGTPYREVQNAFKEFEEADHG